MMISLQEAITRSKNLKRTAEEISSKEKPSKKKKILLLGMYCQKDDVDCTKIGQIISDKIRTECLRAMDFDPFTIDKQNRDVKNGINYCSTDFSQPLIMHNAMIHTYGVQEASNFDDIAVDYFNTPVR